MFLSFATYLPSWIAIVLIMSACGGGSRSPSDMSSGNSTVNISPERLSDPLDPVCGMDMRQIKITDTASYNGNLYAFCNKSCKEAFLANPSQYLK